MFGLKKKKYKNTLRGHLEELRTRLIIIILVNCIGMMAVFTQSNLIMEYLLYVNPGMNLVYTSPSELLLVYIQLSFIVALILCSPITVYQIWAFVGEGLYSHEKKYILISLFFGVFLFIGGAAFCYFVVLPTTLSFFIKIAITEVASMISIASYVSFVNTMLLAFGIVFEMPVLVFLLSKLGLLKPSFLKKNRGLIIVAIFIFAAIITPPDVVSQLMLGLPMVVLMEISIAICVLVDKGKKKKQQSSE